MSAKHPLRFFGLWIQFVVSNVTLKKSCFYSLGSAYCHWISACGFLTLLEAFLFLPRLTAQIGARQQNRPTITLYKYNCANVIVFHFFKWVIIFKECEIRIQYFYAILERPDLPPRSRPSPYFPWPVENGTTVSSTEGQVCNEYWAGPHSCVHPHPWIFATKQQSYVFGPRWEKHPLECESERPMWDWRGSSLSQ